MKALAKLKDDARKHEQREEWDKAISVYVEVLRTAEKGEVEQELPLYNRVGDLYVRLGKPAEAVKYYEQAADHYAEAGLYNNAIALCNKALRYMPDRTELLKKLGQFSALQGFGTDARRWYLEYAEKMLQRGALDDAFGALEDFANLSEDAEIRELLGRQLRTHGRTEQAVVELTRAHTLRLEAGQTTEAERLKKEILALDPNAFSSAVAAPPAPEQPMHSPMAATDLPGLMDLGLESAAGAAFGADTTPDPGMLELPGFDAPVEEVASDEVSSDLPMLDVSMSEPPPVAGLDIGMVELDTPGSSGVDASDLGLEVSDFAVDEDLAGQMSADLPLIEEESSFGMAPLPGFDEPAAPEPDFETEDYVTELPGFDDDLPLLGAHDDELPTLDDSAYDADLPTLDDDPPSFGARPALETDSPTFETELPTFETDLPTFEEDLPTFETDLPTFEEDLPTFEGDLPTFGGDLPTFGERLPTLDYSPENELPPRPEELSPLDADLPALDGAPPAYAENELPELEGPGVLGVNDLTEDDADPAGISDVLFDLPVGELPATPDHPEDEAVPPIALRGAVPEQPPTSDRDFEYEEYELPSIWEDDAGAAFEFEGAEEAEPLPRHEYVEEVAPSGPEPVRHEAVPPEPALFEPEPAVFEPESAGFGSESVSEPEPAASQSESAVSAPPPVEAEPESRTAFSPLPEAPPEPPLQPTHESVARIDYVDLASFLAEDDEPAQPTTRFVVAEKAPTGDEDRDFADMLAQFKQKVAENVSFDDAASHYDLGLAYKEMGLVDEAISEFQVALKAGLERLKVFEELGHCFLLKQQYNIAATVLNRALQLPVTDDIDLIGVHYHLARAYEALGQRDNARSAYERVVGLDIGFQDAADRLARL